MENMWNILKYLVPPVSDSTCELTQTDGPIYVSYWDTEALGPCPTQEELEEAAPIVLLEETREVKLKALADHTDFLINNETGNLSEARKDKAFARQIKLLSKKIKGNTSPEEDAEIDTMDLLSDRLDAIDSVADAEELYLESEERTQQELDDYDVVTTPPWPE